MKQKYKMKRCFVVVVVCKVTAAEQMKVIVCEA